MSKAPWHRDGTEVAYLTTEGRRLLWRWDKEIRLFGDPDAGALVPGVTHAGEPHHDRPRVYTLCGSTRFPEAFDLANMHLSALGHIVIGLGMMGHADRPQGARFLAADGDETSPEKQRLDQLHFRKIDVSDAIYVVNVGGYVGHSTRREIAYALEAGKPVEWMFPVTSTFRDHNEHRAQPFDAGMPSAGGGS